MGKVGLGSSGPQGSSWSSGESPTPISKSFCWLWGQELPDAAAAGGSVKPAAAASEARAHKPDHGQGGLLSRTAFELRMQGSDQLSTGLKGGVGSRVSWFELEQG